MKTNAVIDAIRNRRSTRTYSERQITEEDMSTILDAAICAPSGMNLQTWHFTAIQDTGKLEELNKRIRAAFAKSNDPHLKERGKNESYNCYYHAPTLIIVSNEPIKTWAGQDCATALQNIFLAAHSLGIGSCWINQLGQTCDDPEVREYLTQLGVPVNHNVYGCAALGYNSGNTPKPKTLKEGTVTIIK